MAELTGIQYAILQVLSVQSDGYLCGTQASAFVAEGLSDPLEVYTVLAELQDMGLVEFYTEEEQITLIKVERNEEGKVVLNSNGSVRPILDEEGQIQTEVLSQVADEGWVITPAGKAEV